MITAFGKALRNLRMDKGELLKEMAVKIGVTSSYLSAVEVGKRNIPDGWIDKIADEYNLSAREVKHLRDAAAASVTQVRIDLVGANASERDLACAFAREFNDLTQEQHKAILRILRKD